MCGIAGYLNVAGEPASDAVLHRMGHAIAHRGPDGSGIFTDRALGFAHRRLSIIDLTTSGDQPMRSSDGRYCLIYNGELYNFRELRKELEARGRRFRGRSDSEVLLESLAEWGLDALNKFNGMFAFALWDAKENQLLLARDRYGIKPLYYAQSGKTFAFGSEIKAILAHPAFRAAIDKAGLLEYFTFQNYFSERTMFDGVTTLPAGSYMTIEAGKASEPVRYWDYSFEEPEGEFDQRELEEELHRLFSQAVTRQLVSDVDVGAYLSGGLDSGSIVAIASKQLPNLRTFTVGFDLHSASGLELAFDERDSAEHMSYLFGTEHYEMVLKAGDMERIMPRLARHIEEPRVGQSYPNFYAAHLASKFGKVVLAGTGGDEIFGGYPWRYYRAVKNVDFDSYADSYFAYWQRLLPPDAAKSMFAPIAKDTPEISPRALFGSVFVHHPSRVNRPEDAINASLYFEAKTFLHGLLAVEDKLSMANGLEVRVPFLDNDLVDFAMRLPARTKLGNLGEVMRIDENEPGDKTRKYFQRTHDGKLILRKMMERYIPERITGAVKQGFSAPDESWFKGESIEYVRRLLLDDGAALYDYLDRATVRRLVEDHLSGRENRRLLIWSLLSFENWLGAFLGAGRADMRGVA
jgi:asparagine synthase (glutamine-hydrolysing)